MREQRRKAQEALARLNTDLDDLKGVIAVWGQLIDDAEDQSASPTSGKRPNRKPGKYVRLALERIEAGEKSVSVQDVVSAATKNGKSPDYGNVKAALEVGVERGQLRLDGAKYGRP